MKGTVEEIIAHIPLGYSEVLFEGKKYGMTRKDFNSGKSLKVYAHELGGNDFISFNYYFTSSSTLLKPCEMPVGKVENFLKHYQK